MSEPWDITGSDDRVVDSLPVFIIFCEDQNYEPSYFKSFEKETLLKINCIPNQKGSWRNINNALAYCYKAGIIDFVDNQYQQKTGTNQNIWCVYDRDLENEDLTKIQAEDDTGFTSSIQTANHCGIKVAWSNDAFELWILLHFEKIPTGTRLHRNYIYDRLTEIFKQLPEITVLYETAIQAGQFTYKTALKKRDSFIQFVLPELKKRIEFAMQNAAQLEQLYHNGMQFHDWNPCTKVHHLTAELIAVGSEI